MAKQKKRNNSKRMPIYIPNQELLSNSGYLYMIIEGTAKEMNREHEFQKKLSLRKK